MLLITLLLLALAMLIGAAVALGASPAPSASPSSDTTTLRVGWVIGPDNLNPFIGFELSSVEIMSLQYDTLFNPYPDGSHGPQLALEVPTTQNGGMSADGLVATVKIRDGVRWSDGKPLTAADVAFTYN